MSSAKLSFKTTILLAKKTATGVQVPDSIVEKLGAGKKPAVKVTINGYTYPSTIAVMGGAFMLPVSAAIREKAGVQAGDNVKVELELDHSIREVAIPADFQKALAKNRVAAKFFETLSNSNKKRYVLPIEDAKTDETRLRRIEKAVSELLLQKK